jgi:hypothetical protein
MQTKVRRAVKRLLIRTVKQPLEASARLVHFVMTLEDDERVKERNDFTSTFEYLAYWHRRIVNEISREVGRVHTPGSPAARPHYAWGVLNGAFLARALGIPRISAIEFGVAGGNGLVVLESIAEKVEAAFGVAIDVYGFDSGVGYPPPTDYRDTPNLFQEGSYPIDVPKLQARLKRSQLMVGLVKATLPEFARRNPAPVGFASFDMNLYSATAAALELFCGSQDLLLPRIQCYFGAMMGLTFSDYTADRLAIAEFNRRHEMRKISPCYGLDVIVSNSHLWAGRMCMAHIFDHARYGADDGLVRTKDNALVV